MIWPLFRFQGRNLSNFSVVFWKILDIKKTFWDYLTFSKAQNFNCSLLARNLSSKSTNLGIIKLEIYLAKYCNNWYTTINTVTSQDFGWPQGFWCLLQYLARSSIGLSTDIITRLAFLSASNGHTLQKSIAQEIGRKQKDFIDNKVALDRINHKNFLPSTESIVAYSL